MSGDGTGTRLRIVGFPLGNPEDITLRALKALREADLLLCEDRKSTARYFRHWEIPFPSDSYLLVNEHTSEQEWREIKEAVERSRSAVLVSDQGMPLFCDPGEELIRWARARKIPVEVIPGAVALTTALVHTGRGERGFRFLGFPPRETSERIRFFQEAATLPGMIAFYETPYRGKKVVEEISRFFPAKKKVFVGVNLTMDNEYILLTVAGRLSSERDRVPKGPPVFILYDE